MNKFYGAQACGFVAIDCSGVLSVMAPRESFSVSEPPKLVFCSISGWGWHFVDQKLESAYSEELLKKVYVQMQRLNRVYCIVGCLAFGCFSLHGLSTVPWSTASEAYRACGGDTLVRAMGPFIGYQVNSSFFDPGEYM